MEAQSYIQRALDAIDADLAIALRGVTIAATEESAGVIDGQKEARAGAQLAHIEIAAEGARRASAEGAIVGARYAHDSQEWPDRNDRRIKGAGGFAVELPMEEIGLAETIFEKAETFGDTGPSPIGVTSGEDIDLEDVAEFGTVDEDGAGERVDASAIDGEELRGGGSGADLGAAGVGAFDLDFVARLDVQARREGAVPHGVGGLGGERVHGHDSVILTVICNSTRALRGKALTPTAARTWRPASPKTRTSRSEAPFMTAGESANPGAAFT